MHTLWDHVFGPAIVLVLGSRGLVLSGHKVTFLLEEADVARSGTRMPLRALWRTMT